MDISDFSNMENSRIDKLPTAKEATIAIMKSVNKLDDPIQPLIELYLSSWESKIRYAQIKKSRESALKAASNKPK